jgi:hypothetical protein
LYARKDELGLVDVVPRPPARHLVPIDVISVILPFLDAKSLLGLELVSKHLQELAGSGTPCMCSGCLSPLCSLLFMDFCL